MSATYGVLRSDARGEERTKTGHDYMEATAKTWRTAAEATIRRDGRAAFVLHDKASGRELLHIDVSDESASTRTVRMTARIDGKLIDLPPFTIDTIDMPV